MTNKSVKIKIKYCNDFAVFVYVCINIRYVMNTAF